MRSSLHHAIGAIERQRCCVRAAFNRLRTRTRSSGDATGRATGVDAAVLAGRWLPGKATLIGDAIGLEELRHLAVLLCKLFLFAHELQIRIFCPKYSPFKLLCVLILPFPMGPSSTVRFSESHLGKAALRHNHMRKIPLGEPIHLLTLGGRWLAIRLWPPPLRWFAVYLVNSI